MKAGAKLNKQRRDGGKTSANSDPHWGRPSEENDPENPTDTGASKSKAGSGSGSDSDDDNDSDSDSEASDSDDAEFNPELSEQVRAIANMSLEENIRLGNTPADRANAGSLSAPKKQKAKAKLPAAPVVIADEPEGDSKKKNEYAIEILQEEPRLILSRAEKKAAKKEAAAATAASKQRNVAFDDTSSEEELEYEIPVSLMPGNNSNGSDGVRGGKKTAATVAQSQKTAGGVAGTSSSYDAVPGSRQNPVLAAKQQSEMRNEQVKNDLARLAIIRQQREDAARKREAERLETMRLREQS